MINEQSHDTQVAFTCIIPIPKCKNEITKRSFFPSTVNCIVPYYPARLYKRNPWYPNGIDEKSPTPPPPQHVATAVNYEWFLKIFIKYSCSVK